MAVGGTTIFALMKHMVAQPVSSNGIIRHVFIQGGVGNALHVAIESLGLRGRALTRRKPDVGLQMSFLVSVVLVMTTEEGLPLRLKVIGWSGQTSSIQVALLTLQGGSLFTATATVLATTSCSSILTGKPTLGPVTEH
jgi:hypothetical protein